MNKHNEKLPEGSPRIRCATIAEPASSSRSFWASGRWPRSRSTMQSVGCSVTDAGATQGWSGCSSTCATSRYRLPILPPVSSRRSRRSGWPENFWRCSVHLLWPRSSFVDWQAARTSHTFEWRLRRARGFSVRIESLRGRLAPRTPTRDLIGTSADHGRGISASATGPRGARDLSTTAQC